MARWEVPPPWMWYSMLIFAGIGLLGTCGGTCAGAWYVASDYEIVERAP